MLKSEINRPVWTRVEVLAGIGLSLWVLLLHALFLFHAGPLWRDEAGTIDFAAMPTLSELWHNLQYDNFPPLFVGVARVWTLAGLSGDFSYRLLGFLIGAGTLGVFWFGARTGGARAPLLALALYATNPLAVRVGDAMRPYGLGFALNLLALALTWRFVENPRARSWFWAALAAVLSVQCLYQNAFFLAAFVLAGCAVTLARRKWEAAAQSNTSVMGANGPVGSARCADRTPQRGVPTSRDRRVIAQTVGIGVVAALSLLPHWGNIVQGRAWQGVSRHPVRPVEIGNALVLALNASGPWLVWFWAALALLAIGTALVLAIRCRAGRMVYFGSALVAATLFYGVFLGRIGLQQRSWYFLILLAPAALAMDVILAGLANPAMRLGRAGLALLLAASSIPAGCAAVQVRQSNADLIAQALKESARPGDLILVSPWHYGVALQRYYPNHFETVPPLAELRIHRYDLLKKQMLAENPIASLLEQARQTLRSGHVLWMVGDFEPPPPGRPQPLLPAYREDMALDVPASYYVSNWMFQFSQMVQSHSTSSAQVMLSVPGGGAINGLEDMALLKFGGWRD